MWIKIALREGRFYWIIIGQCFAAVGQPFLLNAPAKLSAAWYSENGRAIATTVASVANPLGVALGFVFPTFFVTEDTYDD